MSAAPRASFGWEIEKSTDELNNAVTTVKCQGRLVSDTAAQLKEVVKPLIPLGGRILMTSPMWNMWTAPVWARWLV